MAVDLANDFREQVRAATDIVGLLGESLSLQPRKGGREYVALCPFHDDHNPSFTVYPDRQTYRCWVCNEGGDVFRWIEKRETVGFREALEILARRANLEMPRTGGQRPAASADNKAQLFEVLLWAEGVFHDALLKAPFAAAAREYLDSRGFTKETVAKFRIGYHPNSGDWLQRQAQNKFSKEQLTAVRLTGERESGGTYDNFRDRVVFPIRNERSQVVGFGGRVLPGAGDGQPKYWNSPESSVFFKSRLVYGLDFAREGLKKTGIALVTEGYTDCIKCHQHGLSNVVGTLGTALTDQHVSTLKRFVKKVVLVYDGDKAGQNAAERAVERFLVQDVDLRIMTLPDNQDPDEFLSARGVDAWHELVATAPEAWEYKFQKLRNRYTVDSSGSRQQVLDEMLTLLSSTPRMSSNVREGMYLANLAQRLGASEQQVRERYRELRGTTVRPIRTVDVEKVDEASARLFSGQLSLDEKVECELLQILVTAPSWIPTAQREVDVDAIRHQRLRELLMACYHAADHGSAASPESLRATFEDGALKRLSVWLDEQARAKDLGRKLTEDDDRATSPAPGQSGAAARVADASSEASTNGCPLFLRLSIEYLQRRREEQSHKRVAMQLSARSDGTHRLDDDTAANLRQLAAFHQVRANRKPPA